jgi:photosystem II stability/assembly factor-like uncharacterized protein
LPDPPAAGRIVFPNADDGWIAGGPGGTRAYRTSDGGNTWQEVTRREAQPQCTTGAPDYTTPVFLDGREGLLPLSYRCSDGAVRSWVYPISASGAFSTRHVAIPAAGPNDVTFAVANPTTFYASGGNGELVVTHDGGGMWETSTPPGFPRTPVILTFGDALHGWAVSNESECAAKTGPCTTLGGLFATTDGGKTWTRLQPH